MSEAAPPRSRVDVLFGIDLRSLAAIRIGAGLLILVDLAMRAPGLRAHYAEDGVLPIETLLRLAPSVAALSPHVWAARSETALALLFALAAVFATALAAGYRTRLATIASWVLLTSLHKRNPVINHGGDQVLAMLLFWGMFLPLGARASLDAVLAPPPRPARTWIRSTASAALLLQICFVYWFAVMQRTSPVWWHGEALHYALNLDFFATPFAVWLRESAALAPLLPLLTFATLAIEAFGPLLAFSPWRTALARLAAIALFAGMHAGFALFLHLGLFSIISVLSWVAFLPAEAWDTIARRSAVRSAADRVQRALAPLRAGGARPVRIDASRGASALAAVALAFVLLLNLRTAFAAPLADVLPRALLRLGRAIGVHQPWSMFSPEPPRLDGYWVFAGRLAGGGEVDAARGRALVFEKPARPLDLAPIDRWSIFLHWAKDAPRQGDLLRPTARYFCARWNETHDGEQQLASLRLIFVAEPTAPPGAPPAPPERRLVLEERCASRS
jgi:hypothetical protein